MTSSCSGNNFRQYRIWDPKDDSRAIPWVSSFPLPSIPLCVIDLASAVSTTSASLCYLACSSWDLGARVAGASVRVAIAACVGLKAFSTFTQDTAISGDVDELYSKILFIMNGVLGLIW